MSRSDASQRASEIEARLRRALSMPLDQIPHGVDMSAAAVTRRVRDACEMSSLCLELAAAGESNR